MTDPRPPNPSSALGRDSIPIIAAGPELVARPGGDLMYPGHKPDQAISHPWEETFEWDRGELFEPNRSTMVVDERWLNRYEEDVTDVTETFWQADDHPIRVRETPVGDLCQTEVLYRVREYTGRVVLLKQWVERWRIDVALDEYYSKLTGGGAAAASLPIGAVGLIARRSAAASAAAAAATAAESAGAVATIAAAPGAAAVALGATFAAFYLATTGFMSRIVPSQVLITEGWAPIAKYFVAKEPTGKTQDEWVAKGSLHPCGPDVARPVTGSGAPAEMVTPGGVDVDALDPAIVDPSRSRQKAPAVDAGDPRGETKPEPPPPPNQPLVPSFGSPRMWILGLIMLVLLVAIVGGVASLDGNGDPPTAQEEAVDSDSDSQVAEDQSGVGNEATQNDVSDDSSVSGDASSNDEDGAAGSAAGDGADDGSAADSPLASTGFLTGTLSFASFDNDQTFESGVDFLIRPDPAGTDIDETAVQLLGSVDEWIAANPAFQVDPTPEIGPFVTLAQFQPGGASQSNYGRLLDGDGLRAILAGRGDKYAEFYLLNFNPCSGFPDTCQDISVDGFNLGLADLDVAAGLHIMAAMNDGQPAPDGALWAFTVTGTMNVLATSTESESITP